MEELDPQSYGVNLKVKVLRVDATVQKGTLRIAEALVGDETSCVVVSLRNGEISLLPFPHLVLMARGRASGRGQARQRRHHSQCKGPSL